MAAEGATLRHARAGLQTPRRSPGGRGSRHAGFEAQGRRRGGGFAHRCAHSPSGSAALRTKRAVSEGGANGFYSPLCDRSGSLRYANRAPEAAGSINRGRKDRRGGHVVKRGAGHWAGTAQISRSVMWSAAMDVGGWLRGLGLGKYEAEFRDNGIDASMLPHLTVEDLKELGVASVGDRRRLVIAIAALASPMCSGHATSSQLSPEAPRKAAQVAAERRPITVMFCDLVGSTSLAARLDAEDWRNLVGAYLDEASAAVTGFGGHVLKKLGDGLMALFGYPQAQENDAERAVRAALAIQRALAELNARNAAIGRARAFRPHRPRVRPCRGRRDRRSVRRSAERRGAGAGGGRAGDGARHREPCSGRPPGCSSSRTRARTTLKGVPAPVALYRIVRASGGGRRGGARVADAARRTRGGACAADAPLGARARRRGSVRPDRRRARHRQVAARSRSSARGSAETPHTWVEWAASQLLQNTPLHPIAEWGRLRFGGADATAERRLADLENTLRLIGLDPAEYAPLLAPLVDIPLPEERRAKFAARGIAAPATGGDDGLGSGGGAVAAGRARLRGPALGRPDLARSHDGARRARRAGAAAHRRDDAAGVPSALGHALASQRHFARAARPRRGAPDGRRDRRAPCALRGDDRGRGRAHRRRAAVRRGGDAPPARARRAGRRAGDPADLAAVARRAARPARRSARGRADRRGAGARFFLPAAARRVAIRRRT